MTEEQATGVFNVAGPVPPIAFHDLLADCRAAAFRSDATFTWVDDQAFLEEHDIKLPLYVSSELEGVDQVDVSRALARGLVFRPIEETARDVLAWVAEDPEARTPDRLIPDREAELLREWHRRHAPCSLLFIPCYHSDSSKSYRS
jgi:2'-hydroxyisoflavone reductase